MQENRNDSELRLLVTGTRRDGRRRYDLQSKRALARACLQPGVSLAGIARQHGVNANLLRKWVLSYQLAGDAGAPAVAMKDCAEAFVRAGAQCSKSKFALLLRLAFLEGANRANTIFSRLPPARVWVFSERITFYPRGAEIKGSGTTAYAWFVWDKDAIASADA